VGNKGVTTREGGTCSRGSEGSVLVWSCLVISVDRQFSFMLFPKQFIHHCPLSTQPSCSRQPLPLFHQSASCFSALKGTVLPEYQYDALNHLVQQDVFLHKIGGQQGDMTAWINDGNELQVSWQRHLCLVLAMYTDPAE
jgi:hypothetical protein